MRAHYSAVPVLFWVAMWLSLSLALLHRSAFRLGDQTRDYIIQIADFTALAKPKIMIKPHRAVVTVCSKYEPESWPIELVRWESLSCRYAVLKA